MSDYFFWPLYVVLVVLTMRPFPFGKGERPNSEQWKLFILTIMIGIMFLTLSRIEEKVDNLNSTLAVDCYFTEFSSSNAARITDRLRQLNLDIQMLKKKKKCP